MKRTGKSSQPRAKSPSVGVIMGSKTDYETMRPAIGVPISSTELNGLDSLLSISQMPKGIPVGTLAVGKPGAANAALLAMQILALTDAKLSAKLKAWRNERMRDVLKQELR
jgi:5-(carboxyamino)imidazole ribonucleotide mutase